MKRGQSKSFLRNLRKKHHLGEFRKRSRARKKHMEATKKNENKIRIAGPWTTSQLAALGRAEAILGKTLFKGFSKVQAARRASLRKMGINSLQLGPLGLSLEEPK